MIGIILFVNCHVPNRRAHQMNNRKVALIVPLLVIPFIFAGSAHPDFGPRFGPWVYYAPYYFPRDGCCNGFHLGPEDFRPKYEDPNPLSPWSPAPPPPPVLTGATQCPPAAGPRGKKSASVRAPSHRAVSRPLSAPSETRPQLVQPPNPQPLRVPGYRPGQ
jgi:hypothetical protein